MSHQPWVRNVVVAVGLAVAFPALAEEKTFDDVIASGGRYGSFSKKAAQGPHLSPVFATHFGGKGAETFVDVAQLPDGTIVAFGNAYGPDFPKVANTTVIGAGKLSGVPAMIKDKQGDNVLDEKSRDAGGFLVFYAPQGEGYKVSRVVRFDWGTLSITSARLAGDEKGLIIAGRCGPNSASVAGAIKRKQGLAWEAPKPPEDPKKARNWKAPDASKLSDVYVARMSPQGQIEWAVILEKNDDPPDEIFTDKKGNVYFDAKGMRRITADGTKFELINKMTGTGTARWLGVDPNDGSIFYGGDRNTNTGHQPYRQPYFYRFNDKGEKTLTLYEPNPKDMACAPGKSGLCSDSAVRSMAFDKNGDWLLGGWSDGGNTVFARQANDWTKRVSSQGMGMDASGANVSSFAHMMRVDGKSLDTKAYTFWGAYVPMYFNEVKKRGKPNGASIEYIRVLDNGSVAFTGGAATGLIQTPNAFWKDPLLPDKHGGAYVAVFRPDLSNLMFSSYTPGVEKLSMSTTKTGLAVVGRSSGSDEWVQPTKSPSIQADQEFGGGLDGWLCILKLPPE